MADNKDELEARRRFRQRLAELGAQYPELKEPESRKRLRETLKEEGTPCHANQQEDPEEDHQEADS